MLAPKVISLNAVVEGVHAMLTRVLGEHVSFELHLSADVPPVRADRGQIEQASSTSSVNARDAMPDGGILSIATAAVDARRGLQPPARRAPRPDATCGSR